MSKQIELEHPDLKQQINFIGRTIRNERAQMFFITEKSQETMFEFSQNAVMVVWFWLHIIMETQKIANLLGDADNAKEQKKISPNEDIIEEYSALHYRTDFTFKKHMLVVEIDEKGMLTEIQIMKRKDKKN